jgi:hypothetical protein
MSVVLSLGYACSSAFSSAPSASLRTINSTGIRSASHRLAQHDLGIDLDSVVKARPPPGLMSSDKWKNTLLARRPAL